MTLGFFRARILTHFRAAALGFEPMLPGSLAIVSIKVGIRISSIEGDRHGHEGTQGERHPIARSAVAARQGNKVRPAEAPPGLTVPGNRACRVALSDLERSNYRLKPCD